MQNLTALLSGSIRTLSMFLLMFGVCPAHADGPADNDPQTVRRIPKEGISVPPEREAALRTKLSMLQRSIERLRQRNDPSDRELLPDVLIFERAVRCALDFNEFFHERELDRADTLLNEGIARAAELQDGRPTWPQRSGLIVRGYISRIDHTVQPYGLVVPGDYDFDHSVPARCDLWFHGRGETLSEVNFLWDRMQNSGQYTPDHTIVLHPYGRYSNAFRFAGETDVLEALDDVQRRYRIDDDRISVRGFSMGGAACWQFAVHYADRWFAANPGAGFSETQRFLESFQGETLNPKPWEKTLWNLYDCDKWAINLRHCPTIAYSGELDRQKQAADVMAEALTEYDIRLRHIIGAGQGHAIDDASKELIEAAMSSLAKKGRESAPSMVTLQTYTLRYNRMHWLTVDGLMEHWSPAFAEARVARTLRIPGGDSARSGGPETNPPDQVESSSTGLKITLRNVSAVTVAFAAGTVPKEINGMQVVVDLFTSDADGGNAAFQQIEVPGPESDGSWRFSLSRSASAAPADGIHPASQTSVFRHSRTQPPEGPRKRHGLQGPIDDAFLDAFVFVRPTGPAANSAVGQWTESELNRAIEHWRRHFRGDARVVDDSDVTEDLIHSANLVLWGDPSSNAMIAKVIGELPIKWSDKSLSIGSTNYDAKNHAPALIYPNPLNPDRYVVLNSSFTFRDYAYLNNARQVPMLPDWAVINLDTPPGTVRPGDVVAADFFDESWQLK